MLITALAAARAEFGPIRRTKTVSVTKKSGGTYTFRYAPYEEIVEAVEKPLLGHGIVFTHVIENEELVTLLFHESGEWMQSRIPLGRAYDMQGYGSQLTYSRRYALSGILGIATDDDDDGNIADGNQFEEIEKPHKPKAAHNPSMKENTIGPEAGHALALAVELAVPDGKSDEWFRGLRTLYSLPDTGEAGKDLADMTPSQVSEFIERAAKRGVMIKYEGAAA